MPLTVANSTSKIFNGVSFSNEDSRKMPQQFRVWESSSVRKRAVEHQKLHVERASKTRVGLDSSKILKKIRELDIHGFVSQGQNRCSLLLVPPKKNKFS